MDYVAHLIILVLLYGSLAISLDLLVGHGGLISLSHAAFFSFGAYCSAVLSARLNTPFLIGLIAGVVLASVASLLVALPSIRLRDDYLVIVTLGFQMIVGVAAKNLASLTNGPRGVFGFAPIVVFGYPLGSPSRFLPLLLLVFVGMVLVIRQLTEAPFGRALRAVRDDEVLAKAYGRDVVALKISAFGVSAALAAIVGSFYAHYTRYIDPDSLRIEESILVLSMVLVGGAGSRRGALLGATLLVLLPEVLRFVGVPGALAANLREIIYGCALVVVAILRPRGLAGEYGFESR